MENVLTRIVIENNGILKSFCWLSVQKDNSISVGMTDKTFIVPSITVSTEIDKKVSISSIDYKKIYPYKAIQNPHFTFHPGCWYHLRANKQKPLFQGLLMVDMVVNDCGYLPWIRYISNPVKNLKSFQNQSHSKEVNVIKIIVPDDEVSIQIGFDFIKDIKNQSPNSSGFFDDFVKWGNRIIHIFAEILPGQKATLWWNHES